MPRESVATSLQSTNAAASSQVSCATASVFRVSQMPGYYSHFLGAPFCCITTSAA